MLCMPLQSAWAQNNEGTATTVPRQIEGSSQSEPQKANVIVLPEAPYVHHTHEELVILEKENSAKVTRTSAHRLQQTTDTAHTTYIITDDIISTHGWRTLAEILRHVPGIHTIMSESQFQNVAIRGMAGIDINNSRILWLVDDVPMHNIHTSGIWLDETFPVDLIRRIEVVTGPAGSTYGAGAYQGVIHIITKTAADLDKYGEYKIALGDHQTFKASAAYAYTADNGFSILGHLAVGTTQGPGLIADSVYNNYVMDEAKASVSGSKQPTSYRKNKIDNSSAKTWYDIDLKLNYHDFSFKIGFEDIYAHADGSEIHHYLGTYPTPVTTDTASSSAQNMVVNQTVPLTDPYEFNRRSLLTSASYNHSFGNLVDLNALLSYRFNQFEHQNYHGLSETIKGENDTTITRHYHYDISENMLHLNVQTDWHIARSNILTAGFSMDYDHLSDNMLTRKTIGYLTPSLYINDEQRLYHNRIILSAGYRFDAYEATEDLTPASSAHFSFTGKWARWFTTRMSYAYATHVPSLQQRYLNTSDLVGSEKITKEGMHNADLALMFDPLETLHIQINGFGSFFDHLSGLYPSNQPGTVLGYIQSDAGYIIGAELMLNAIFAQAWHLDASYSIMHSELDTFTFTSPTTHILTRYQYPSIPEDTSHQIKLSASYTNDSIKAGLALFVLAGAPETVSGYVWRKDPFAIPAYAVLQPHISVALPVNLGMMVQGSYAFSEGMTDSPTYRYYYEREGVPVSRYSVMLSLLYPFRKSVN